LGCLLDGMGFLAERRGLGHFAEGRGLAYSLAVWLAWVVCWMALSTCPRWLVGRTLYFDRATPCSAAEGRGHAIMRGILRAQNHLATSHMAFAAGQTCAHLAGVCGACRLQLRVALLLLRAVDELLVALDLLGRERFQQGGAGVLRTK